MGKVKVTSKELSLIKKAKDILVAHKGKENAIPAREIAQALGIKEGDTFIRTRSIIDKAIRKYKLPVAAHTYKGYFFIESEDELFEYMGSLEGRKMQIEDKKQLIFRNYQDYYGVLVVSEEE
jgi:hypothetical protein